MMKTIHVYIKQAKITLNRMKNHNLPQEARVNIRFSKTIRGLSPPGVKLQKKLS
jgi:hypothetical protein